jgi:hypothetical protein
MPPAARPKKRDAYDGLGVIAGASRPSPHYGRSTIFPHSPERMTAIACSNSSNLNRCVTSAPRSTRPESSRSDTWYYVSQIRRPNTLSRESSLLMM